jgi:hypothetical protein
VGVLEEVSEEKIEVVVEERFLAAVLAAVKEAHPYEEPAILVFPMLDYKRIIGRESNEDCVESAPTAVEHAAGLDGYRSYYAVSVYVPVQSSPKVRSALAQAKAGNFTSTTHIALSVKGVVFLTALYCTVLIHCRHDW